RRTVEQEKTQSLSWLTSQLMKLAAACSAEMSKPTLAVYIDRLSTYPPKLIEAALKLTIDSWEKPNMLPPIGYIVQRIDHVLDQQREQRREEQSRALMDRPSVHPEKTVVRDGQETQRIILESKASGNFGQDAIAPAKAALAAMDRGEAVTAPASLD